MKRRVLVGGLVLAAQIIWRVTGAFAGPFEDGMAAYNCGDYVPTIAVYRAFAEQGNVEAQARPGVTYRRGQGVIKRSSARADLWLSRAASRGNARARTELREVSQSMTAEQIAEACGASD
jgi:hypothetical protein